MRNRLKFVALLASICSGAWLCCAAMAADQPAGPQVSKAVAKPLKAAQEALQGAPPRGSENSRAIGREEVIASR